MVCKSSNSESALLFESEDSDLVSVVVVVYKRLLTKGGPVGGLHVAGYPELRGFWARKAEGGGV